MSGSKYSRGTGLIPELNKPEQARSSKPAESGKPTPAAMAAERERSLDEALAAGKFSENRRAHYAALYDKDPAGTKALLNMLASVHRHESRGRGSGTGLFPEL